MGLWTTDHEQAGVSGGVGVALFGFASARARGREIKNLSFALLGVDAAASCAYSNRLAAICVASHRRWRIEPSEAWRCLSRNLLTAPFLSIRMPGASSSEFCPCLAAYACRSR
ncbi:hypothetical protein LY78DRAFT_425720 [Colletotrichum sublineola]|nr:hypothetical protein LY78DRAFT_425720 [Colletotrichum sublineola]